MSEKVKFNFTTKLNLACSDNPLVPKMNCVHFVGGFAFASNGHILIKQSLELHSVIDAINLDTKAIHRDSYRAIMQFETATANEEGIECSNSDGNTAFFPYFDMKGETAPDFDKLYHGIKLTKIDFIGVNAKLIDTVIKAMYLPSGQLRIQFSGVDKPMICDAPGVEDQIAIIMPVLIEPTLF